MSLDAHDISVAFGGLKVLTKVSVKVERGSITGLVGPNGAGKTTLFNCLTGVVVPQEGTVEIEGQDISSLPLDRRIQLGISRTFQTPRLDLDASVLDAVMLGFYSRNKPSLAGSFFSTAARRRHEGGLREQAEALIAQFELTTDPHQRSGALSLGRQRLLEVARAIASEPRYLLLDEPAAGIDEHDRRLLARAIRKAAERKVGVLLVEHNVGFVAELSDQMLALVRGEVVAGGSPQQVVNDPEVVTAYLGGQHVAA
ncbi:Lipopolysaccharide export system ATP-binding protein LptB [Variovorax sp. PBL-H6]|uniref:ABC transporter ATP-binding protein n=1 Tax=Variovorax sp. PBL-H6 TaxID=434009 RepID=UPI001317A1F7|nr:ABC transporter ATP-binding protein [Variovorax sp. PBL-H6]VTU38011.1 Lipopolysaccharide export system ATP-binding protein LptB [Variovorax sp. PBL-H6]